jgi:hypothetical protein
MGIDLGVNWTYVARLGVAGRGWGADRVEGVVIADLRIGSVELNGPLREIARDVHQVDRSTARTGSARSQEEGTGIHLFKHRGLYEG